MSALFLARELDLRYDTAWLIAHKLRHALSERLEFALTGLLEIDESYYGGRGKPASRGRSLADRNKSLMAIAVETVPAFAAAGQRHQGAPLRRRQCPHRRPAFGQRGKSRRFCPQCRQARHPHHHPRLQELRRARRRLSPLFDRPRRRQER